MFQFVLALVMLVSQVGGSSGSHQVCTQLSTRCDSMQTMWHGQTRSGGTAVVLNLKSETMFNLLVGVKRVQVDGQAYKVHDYGTAPDIGSAVDFCDNHSICMAAPVRGQFYYIVLK